MPMPPLPTRTECPCSASGEGANKCPASCTVPNKPVGARLVGNVQVVCEVREARGRSGQHLILRAELGHGRAVRLVLGRGGCWGHVCPQGELAQDPLGFGGLLASSYSCVEKCRSKRPCLGQLGPLGSFSLEEGIGAGRGVCTCQAPNEPQGQGGPPPERVRGWWWDSILCLRSCWGGLGEDLIPTEPLPAPTHSCGSRSG